MTAQSAKQIIGEALNEFQAVVRGGFRDYFMEYGQQAHKHHPRTRACLIHDHMVSRAKDLATNLPGFKFIRRTPRNFFDFGQKILVQFKKLSPKLLTKNNPTQLSLALEECPQVLSLPGIPPKLPLITVGYVPSHDHSAIDGIFVTFVERRKLKWHLSLTTEEVLTPLPEQNEQPIPARKRVHAKGRRRDSGGAAAAL